MKVKSILIVDDEKELRESLANIFQLEGFDVRVATNGLEAFAAMNDFAPDLIISDINMPDCNGLVLFREVHRLYTPPIPMIFLSGYVGTVAVDELSNKENFVAIFSKPVDVAVILKKIDEMNKNK